MLGFGAVGIAVIVVVVVVVVVVPVVVPVVVVPVAIVIVGVVVGVWAVGCCWPFSTAAPHGVVASLHVVFIAVINVALCLAGAPDARVVWVFTAGVAVVFVNEFNDGVHVI